MPRGPTKPVERGWIEKDLKEMKRDEGWDYIDNNLFQIWVMRLLHFSNATSNNQEAYELSMALLNEYGKGDQKLDGFYHDASENALYLYQMKWPEATTKSKQNDAQELHTALSKLLSDVHHDKKVGAVRDGAKAALQEILNSQGSIHLRGISGTRWLNAETVEAKLAEECQALPIKDCNIHVELLDVDDLLLRKTSLTKTLTGKSWPFKFYKGTEDPIMRFPDQGKDGLGDSIVGLISARSIGEAVQQYESQLFDLNVRHYHGGKNKVNKFITRAILDEESRKGFWYGHNGITICCDGYEEVGGPDKPEEIVVSNPQIVNGCQSANSFSEILKDSANAEILDEVGVLVRIIKIDAEEDEAINITGNIAWATNNQSAIKDSDLKSNDSSQVKYAGMLKEYQPPWFYERKTNEWAQFKRLRKREYRKYKEAHNSDRMIVRERYQKSWRAYSGDPAGSVQKSNDVWGIEKPQLELYERVFSAERRPCDIIFVSVLFDWTRELFKYNQAVEYSEYGHLEAAKKTGMDHKNYMKLLGKAAGLVQAYSIYIFGALIKHSYGDLDNIERETIDYLCERLPRGTAVAKKRFTATTKEVIGVLDTSLIVMFRVWDEVISRLTDDKDPDAVDPDVYGGALRDFLKKEDAKGKIDRYLNKTISVSGTEQFITLDN